MRAGLTVALVLWWAAAAAAAPPRPDDFAYGIPIAGASEGAVYRLVLPEAVYQTVVREDLADLRVFNAAGDPVPHALEPDQGPPPSAAPPQVLPFFPLPEGPAGGSDSLGADIETDARGAVLRIRIGEAEAAPGRRRYLVDLSALAEPPEALELEWAGEAGGDFMAAADLAASSDLRTWQPLTAATLADLRFAEHRLHSRRLDLPAAAGRYLRLSWTALVGEASLTRVRGLPRAQAAEPTRFWRRLTADPSVEAAGTVAYDAGGPFPVDRVWVRLPDVNSLSRVTVSSRSDPATIWRLRHRGLAYHLRLQGATLQNPPAPVPPTGDRYWHLEADPDGGGLGPGAPVVEVGWVPHQLVFLARGPAPFLLAFGSAAVPGAPEAGKDLLTLLGRHRESVAVQPADLGSPMELGGPARRTPPPAPVPWQRYLLWGILALGVVALGVMAARLLKTSNPIVSGEGGPGANGVGPDT